MEKYVVRKQLALPGDIVFIEDELPFGRRQFIVGSKEKNSYFHISYQQFQTLKIIKEYIDQGIKEISDIEERLLEEKNLKVDISRLYDVLEKNSLLKESKRTKGKSEAELMSIQLYNIPLYLRETTDSSKAFLKILKFVFFISLVVSVVGFRDIVQIFMIHKFKWNNSSLLGFLMGGIVSIFTLLVHECAHIYAARVINMKQAVLNIVLYASFIPTYYTKYDGMEIRPYKERVKVLSAGLKSNLFLVVVSAMLMIIPSMNDTYYDVLSKVVLVNLQFIAINLSPFAMNDGYFILMNFLGLPGVRVNMWNAIIGFFKHKKAPFQIKNKIPFFIYTILSLTFLGINACTLISWIYYIIIELK